MSDDDPIVRDTIRAFRSREVEGAWESLDRPEREPFERLWAGLSEVGVPLLALPESEGGLALGPDARFEILSELGAGSPALATAVVSHLSAVTLAREASAGPLPGALASAASEARWSLVASPLETRPETGFELRSNGARVLSGEQRAIQPFADWLGVPCVSGSALQLAVVPADADGLAFDRTPSIHGLKLLPFGTLRATRVEVEHVLPWPASGRAQRLADGMFTAVFEGMLREMADRAMGYALERYQGGKMIHEHDAVRLLVAPILLAARALRPLGLHTLTTPDAAADAGASAFAVELTRRCGLDAIQTFGGYGYMEDYRVERYLRDANTLETFFVHASAARRRIAAARFAELAT